MYFLNTVRHHIIFSTKRPLSSFFVVVVKCCKKFESLTEAWLFWSPSHWNACAHFKLEHWVQGCSRGKEVFSNPKASRRPFPARVNEVCQVLKLILWSKAFKKATPTWSSEMMGKLINTSSRNDDELNSFFLLIIETLQIKWQVQLLCGRKRQLNEWI